MCVYEGGFAASHNVRKCLQVGLSNAFYALQCMEQCLLALGSNTLDIVQFAMQCMLGALVAMEGDGEAVYLVLDACESMEKFAFHIDSDGLDGVTVQEFVGAVTVVFGQAGYRDVEVQFAMHHAADNVHLTLTTIGNDEVG